MSDREQRFIEAVRDGYQPDDRVGRDLERRVLGSVDAPRRARWAWAMPGLAVAATAAMALWLWPRPASAPSRPTAPPAEVAALALALETDAEIESEALPGEYAVLADVWEEESGSWGSGL